MDMHLIGKIRKDPGGILAIGMHLPIFQSTLDFDHLCGRTEQSLVAIIASNRRSIKLFFGPREVLIPCFTSVRDVPAHLIPKVQWMLNVQSARRALESTVGFFDVFPA